MDVSINGGANIIVDEANASDPNEMSFKKGDILTVLDNKVSEFHFKSNSKKGKWWHVQMYRTFKLSPASVTTNVYIK
jgi:Variant SH3 domain